MDKESYFNTHTIAAALETPWDIFWAVVTVVVVIMATIVLTRFIPHKEY